MKALTIKSPWAELIALGEKDIENRTWRTHYRGPLAIHVARWKRNDDEIERISEAERIIGDFERWVKIDDELASVDAYGCVVAIARLVDIVQDHPSKWAIPGWCHWVLADVEPIEFVPAKGRQGLWEWTP